MTAHRDVHIKTDIVIHHTERNGICSAVFISNDFFYIEEINALVLARISAHGNTFYKLFKAFYEIFPKISIKNTWLCGSIINKFSGLGTNLHNRSLVYDHHTLPFIDCNDRSVGNDVIIPLVSAKQSSFDTFLSFFYENICLQCGTVKIFTPLILKHTCSSSHTNLYNSHLFFLLTILSNIAASKRYVRTIPLHLHSLPCI